MLDGVKIFPQHNLNSNFGLKHFGFYVHPMNSIKAIDDALTRSFNVFAMLH